MEIEKKEFRGYDYKKITADMERLSFLLEGYESFGWEQDAHFSESDSRPDRDKRTVLLRRDRKILNKMELTRLQRNFEACINEIETLENAKTSRAAMIALITGIAGTAFMACSVFAVTAQPPHILLCIVLSVPGILGWVLPVFVYKRVTRIQTEKLTPLIEAKYDEIYEICAKGRKL